MSGMEVLPMLSAAGSILGGVSAVAGLAGGGGGKDTPAPPPIAPPTPMPIADDSKVKAARRRSTVEQMQRQGRESTILTQGSEEKLGG